MLIVCVLILVSMLIVCVDSMWCCRYRAALHDDAMMMIHRAEGELSNGCCVALSGGDVDDDCARGDGAALTLDTTTRAVFYRDASH